MPRSPSCFARPCDCGRRQARWPFNICNSQAAGEEVRSRIRDSRAAEGHSHTAVVRNMAVVRNRLAVAEEAVAA